MLTKILAIENETDNEDELSEKESIPYKDVSKLASKNAGIVRLITQKRTLLTNR